MKTPSWSNAILLAIIIVAVAHGQAQRGPAVPQMRGDGIRKILPVFFTSGPPTFAPPPAESK